MLLPENPPNQAFETATSKKKPVKTTRRMLASWSRWAHIYLSMFGLAVILFFSVTGLTLNHPDWFFDEQTIQSSGSLDVRWLNRGGAPPE